MCTIVWYFLCVKRKVDHDHRRLLVCPVVWSQQVRLVLPYKDTPSVATALFTESTVTPWCHNYERLYSSLHQ